MFFTSFIVLNFNIMKLKRTNIKISFYKSYAIHFDKTDEFREGKIDILE